MSGPYKDMDITKLYSSIGEKFNNKEPRWYAYYYVEAENFFAIRQVCIEWFNALQEGTANNRFPDLDSMETRDGEPITQERADTFIEELEEDMMKEKARFSGLERNSGPGYTRLKPHSRIAFMQSVWDVMMTEEELLKEAERRVAIKDLPDVVLKNIEVAYPGYMNEEQ